MRDADWSRENLLRSDWLGPSVALYTTQKKYRYSPIYETLRQSG